MAVTLQEGTPNGGLVSDKVIATYTVQSMDHNKHLSQHAHRNHRRQLGEHVSIGQTFLQLGSRFGDFHFNGGNPITKYKTLLPSENFYQFFWDKNDHLCDRGSTRPNWPALCLQKLLQPASLRFRPQWEVL
jgi:hypothetical protein